MRQERDSELAWVAGYLSSKGSFTVVDGSRVRFVLRTTGSPEGLYRVREALNMRANVYECTVNKTQGWMLSSSGEALHEALKPIWDLLTKERRAQYVLARRKARSSHP